MQHGLAGKVGKVGILEGACASVPDPCPLPRFLHTPRSGGRCYISIVSVGDQRGAGEAGVPTNGTGAHEGGVGTFMNMWKAGSRSIQLRVTRRQERIVSPQKVVNSCGYCFFGKMRIGRKRPGKAQAQANLTHNI